MKNQKNSFFPKRDVLKAFVKGLKRGLFQEQIFSKKISEVNFGQNLIMTKVFMSNSVLLNTLALSESRFEARNTKIGFVLINILVSPLSIFDPLNLKSTSKIDQ